MKEIIDKLRQIKADIENAFEKELIDFDEIETGISSVIEAIQDRIPQEKSGDKTALGIGNYI